MTSPYEPEVGEVTAYAHLPLPPYGELIPVFVSRLFFVLLGINVILTAVVNAVIDYFFNRSVEDLRLFSSGVIVNIVIFNLVMVPIVFAGSGFIQKQIIAGKRAAVLPRALTNNWAKRWLAFSMCQRRWYLRLLLFWWQVLIFPALPIAMFCLLACAVHTGFGGIKCKVGIAGFVAFTEVWKLLNVMFLFCVNFAAAHNADQPELRGAPVSETPLVWQRRSEAIVTDFPIKPTTA